MATAIRITCTILTHHPRITQTKDGVPWPKIYGGGVEVETGEVFTAQVLFLMSSPLFSSTLLKIIVNTQFTYHGPDADIRQLRLHSSGATLANIYDPYSGKVVVSVYITYIVKTTSEM